MVVCLCVHVFPNTPKKKTTTEGHYVIIITPCVRPLVLICLEICTHKQISSEQYYCQDLQSKLEPLPLAKTDDVSRPSLALPEWSQCILKMDTVVLPGDIIRSHRMEKYTLLKGPILCKTWSTIVFWQYYVSLACQWTAPKWEKVVFIFFCLFQLSERMC